MHRPYNREEVEFILNHTSKVPFFKSVFAGLKMRNVEDLQKARRDISGTEAHMLTAVLDLVDSYIDVGSNRFMPHTVSAIATPQLIKESK